MLLLKLTLAPLLILLVSLAERKWGAAVSGLLVGLPLTTGPVLLILSLERGAVFSAHTSVGSLLGLAALAAFALTYARVSRSRGWAPSLLVSTGCYVVVATVLLNQPLRTGTWAFLLACCALVAARLSLPRTLSTEAKPQTFGNGEVVVRMATAAALVFSLTGVATLLGPAVSGAVAMFPIYTSIVAVFNHMKSNAQALSVLKGAVTGGFGTAAFLAILIVSLGSLPTGFCFVLAVAGAAGVEALLFPYLKRAS